MIRRPPRSTRTDTLSPYTTLFRSEMIPLVGFAQMTLLGAVLGGLMLAGLNRWSTSARRRFVRSEEHTSELQSLMRNSYAVFFLKKKKLTDIITTPPQTHYAARYHEI